MRSRVLQIPGEQDCLGLSRRSFLTGAVGLGLAGIAVPMLSRAQATPPQFDFYISPTGSDSNPGTQASPWSINALNTHSEIQGKRVGLLDGTYILTQTPSGGAGGPLNADGGYILLVNQGGPSPSQPTIIQAVNPRQAVITTNNGGTYPQATAAMWNLSADNITVDGLKFYQGSFSALQVHGSNCVIKNCWLRDFDFNRYPAYAAQYAGDNIGAIIIGNGKTNLLISNCLIEHVRNGNGSHNAACLGPWYHFTNVTVEYCTILDATTGVYFKNDVSGLTVRNCYFGLTQLGILGFMSYSTNRPKLPNLAYNNIFNRINQILDWADDNAAADVSFYNNTVIAGPRASTYGSLATFSNPAGPSVIYQANFYNNLWYYTSSSAPVYVFLASSAPPPSVLAVLDYNGYSASNFSIQDLPASTTFTTLASWQTAVGKDTASQQASDPKFVNSNGITPADFALQTSSPYKNAGRVGGVASGAAVDMGAWGGATSIGANFGPTPNPPVLQAS